MDSTYQIQTISTTDKDLKKLSDFLNEVFAVSSFTIKYLKHLYLKNPEGEVIGFNAFHEQKIIAHYATIPVSYSYDSIIYKGLLSLNTATHKEHSGKGLFNALAKKTYDLASTKEFDFVIGVANQNSTHSFTHKLGFELIAPLNTTIGFGLKKINPMDSVFKRNWTPETLEWRLKFKESYFSNQQLILTKTHYSFIESILYHSSELQNFLKEHKSLKLKLLIGHQLPYKQRIYFKIPKKLKPSPLNLIFKDLNGKTMEFKKHLQFWILDFDAF